jgi:hypothetical protein
VETAEDFPNGRGNLNGLSPATIFSITKVAQKVAMSSAEIYQDIQRIENDFHGAEILNGIFNSKSIFGR